MGTCQPGDVVDRYRVERVLGAGGMGEVYLARHTFTSAQVALKLLLPDVKHRELLTGKMHAEASLLAQIRHPNLVQVLDAGMLEDGRIWMVMELLDGASLEDVLEREGALPAVRALRYAIQVAEAIAVVHGAGVIHRDLKPANIQINSADQVKVLDFGTARFTGSQAASMTGPVAGTIAYMSVEHLSGQPVDGRTDVYALGIILYQMLAGRHPLQDADGGFAPPMEMIARVQLASFESLADVVGAAVWAPIEQALRGDREQRQATMAAFALALREVLLTLPGGAEALAGAGASTSSGVPVVNTGPLPGASLPGASLPGAQQAGAPHAPTQQPSTQQVLVAGPSPAAAGSKMGPLVVAVSLLAALGAGAAFFALGGDRAADDGAAAGSAAPAAGDSNAADTASASGVTSSTAAASTPSASAYLTASASASTSASAAATTAPPPGPQPGRPGPRPKPSSPSSLDW